MATQIVNLRGMGVLPGERAPAAEVEVPAEDLEAMLSYARATVKDFDAALISYRTECALAMAHVDGRQAVAVDNGRLVPVTAKPGFTQFVSNGARRLVHATVARATSNRPWPGAKPIANSPDQRDAARIVDAGLKYIYEGNGGAIFVDELFKTAVIQGTAFAYTEFYDDKICMRSLMPWQVSYCTGFTASLDDAINASAVIAIRRYYTKYEAIKRFPNKAKEILDAAPQVFGNNGYASSTSGAFSYFAPRDSGGSTLSRYWVGITEYWIRPGKHYFAAAADEPNSDTKFVDVPGGYRITAIGDDGVMLDASPWPEPFAGLGEFPVIPFSYGRLPGRFESMGLPALLYDIETARNVALNAYMETAKWKAYPIILNPAKSGMNPNDFVFRRGAVWRYHTQLHGGEAAKPGLLETGTMPPEIMDGIGTLAREADNVAFVTQADFGEQIGSLRTTSAMAMLEEAKNILFAPIAAYLLGGKQSGLMGLGRHLACMMAANWEDGTVIRAAGSAYNTSSENWRSDIIGEGFSIAIDERTMITESTVITRMTANEALAAGTLTPEQAFEIGKWGLEPEFAEVKARAEQFQDYINKLLVQFDTLDDDMKNLVMAPHIAQFADPNIALAKRRELIEDPDFFNLSPIVQNAIVQNAMLYAQQLAAMAAPPGSGNQAQQPSQATPPQGPAPQV